MSIFSDRLLRFIVSLLVCALVIAGVYYVAITQLLGVAILLGVLLCYWTYTDLKNAERDQYFKENQRGRQMKSHREAVKRAEDMRTPGDEGILWGKLRLKRKDATNHFCVVGAVGSGKTLTLRMLMLDQLPKIKKGSDSCALIYDAKQDMVQIIASMKLSCPVVLLNPFDTRASVWDMAADIDSPATARQLADTLVPEQEKESQPFFSTSVRELITAVVTALILTRPNAWTFRDLLLVMKSKDLLRRLLGANPYTRATAASFLESGETTLGSIIATIATKLGPYESIAAAWEKNHRKVSIKQWVNNEAVLILGNDERVRATLDAMNRLFVSVAAQQLLSMPESDTRLNWLIFDEFAEAGKLAGLESLILRGRSKGCAVVLGFQDIEHVQQVYRVKLANALVGQCGNKCFLRMESPQTAEWAQKCVGDIEKIEVNYSVTNSPKGGNSSTESFQRQTRPQVMASQFLELPPSPEKGLEGYYLTRSVGCYSATYLPAEWQRLIGTLDKQISPFDPVPTSFQLLTEFSTADAERLGIPPDEKKATERNGSANLNDIGRAQ